jgi:DnaJ-class molecular chaperone
MNMEQQIERQRVLYYQSLEFSRLLSDLAYEYHLKDERYERVERLNRKAEARMDRRFDRLMELHEAYMAYLQKQIDSSMKSTGLALSPAQPVEAVGQGATVSDPGSLLCSQSECECPACNGLGEQSVNGSSYLCSDCDGSGYRDRSIPCESCNFEELQRCLAK